MGFGKRGGKVPPPPRHRQTPLNGDSTSSPAPTIDDLPGEARIEILAPLVETPQHWDSEHASLSEDDKELLKKLLADDAP
ncbi:MAG: hypothetical protein R3D67_03485 [Hyphomicrobiaceae bacterium]